MTDKDFEEFFDYSYRKFTSCMPDETDRTAYLAALAAMATVLINT